MLELTVVLPAPSLCHTDVL